MQARIAFGHVIHRRLRPVAHAFAYPVFFLRVPLSQLDRMSWRWLSVDRWNLFSLMRRDFGPRDGSDLEAWARALLRANDVVADGEIVLQAFPRMLGYVFNPIVTWHCHDRAGLLRAVICEVSNTFGEHHNYLVAHADGRAIEAGDWLIARKALHVSPFCEVVGHYRFRFAGGDEAPRLRIDYHDDEGRLLVTALRGKAEALRDARLLGAFFAYPWMTLAVTVRIHWQAARLWARNVPWFRKPDPPLKETSR